MYGIERNDFKEEGTMKLEGRKAVVTGSDSGIGQAIATTFAREGADVVVHYNSDRQGAEKTADAVRQHGRQVEILQADLSDPQKAQQFFDQARSFLGTSISSSTTRAPAPMPSSRLKPHSRTSSA